MRFVSTRGGETVSLDEALVNGIAGNGGLYIPVGLPTFGVSDFDAASSIPEVAEILLRPFFSSMSLVPTMITTSPSSSVSCT